MVRGAALIVALSLSAAAAAPLICEVGCAAEETTAQTCHEQRAGQRFGAHHPECTHATDDAVFVASGSKNVGAKPLSGEAHPSHAATALTRRVHDAVNPPGLPLFFPFSSRSVLRI